MDQILIRLEQEGMNSDIIKDLINDHRPRATKMKDMYDRYKADKLAINSREFLDPTKINNKISNDYRGEIVESITGYLFGRPVSYQVDGINYGEMESERLNNILDRWEMLNDLPDLDNETGKIAVICGYGSRLMYIDKIGEERAANIFPWETIFINNQADTGLEYALRYYPMTIIKDGNETIRTRVEWYDFEAITYYIEDGKGNYILDDSEEVNPQYHMFDYVPLIKFANNDEEMGDFEKVEPLIDAYDRLVSDSQNELEEFRQAYMKFIGGEVDSETVKKARQSGAFSLPEGGDVGFITKQVNDVFLENQKRTLNDNIYKFSQTVDMADEKFSGAGQSGESRKWKLLALENKAINKERKFTRALREQFKILCSAWNKKGIALNYLDIYFTFTRNTPIDMGYYATIIKDLKGLISDETLYSNIPFIDDPQLEIQAMEEAVSAYITIPDEVEEDEEETTTE